MLISHSIIYFVLSHNNERKKSPSRVCSFGCECVCVSLHSLDRKLCDAENEMFTHTRTSTVVHIYATKNHIQRTHKHKQRIPIPLNNITTSKGENNCHIHVCLCLNVFALAMATH